MSMDFVFVFTILMTLFPIYIECQASCQNVTTFSSFCSNNSVVYILSASPCQEMDFISITIVNEKKLDISHTVTGKDIDEPIPIDDDPGKGIILVMHDNPHEEYRKNSLHVMLYHVDIAQYNATATTEYLLMSREFHLFYEECSSALKQDITTGFKKQEICAVSLRMSEYSTLCFLNKNNNTISTGSYIIFMDPCSIPQSATVLTIINNKFIINRYTESKTNALIKIDNNPNCGLNIELKYKGDMDIFGINLFHSCGNNSTRALITDDYYTELGMICPLAECQQTSKLQQKCQQNWIYDSQRTKLAHSSVILDICKEVVQVAYTVNVGSSDKSYPGAKTMILKADHENAMHDMGNAVPYTAGLALHRLAPKTAPDGNLDLGGGNVSLYIHEIEEENIVHVLILRHYPSMTDFIPILHTEFHVRREDVCNVISHPHKGDNSIKVALPLVIGALVMFGIIVVAIVLWRKRQRRIQMGLPFQIHLDANEMEDDFTY